MPEYFDIAVKGRFGQLLFAVPCAAVLPNEWFCDAPDAIIRKIGKKYFQSVEVMGTRRAFGYKAGRKFAKRHFRGRLRNLVPPPVQFFLKFVLDRFRLTAVSGAR
jgi:hypothetical protein